MSKLTAKIANKPRMVYRLRDTATRGKASQGDNGQPKAFENGLRIGINNSGAKNPIFQTFFSKET
jgi:hypothetical protein